MNCRAITVDLEIMHGTPCFTGTRVPVKSLFDHLAHGYSLDYFLYEFPTVPRELAVEVLECAGNLVDEAALAPAGTTAR